MNGIDKGNNGSNFSATAGGTLVARVINADGSIAYESDKKHNLVLYGGIEKHLNNGTASWGGWVYCCRYCRVGSGNTPNFTTPAGTYSQSGTTVTRDTGAVDFVAGDVGATIKFSTGEEAYIVTYTNATTVEVRETATVAATTIVLWLTNQTALETPITNTSSNTGSGRTTDFVDASSTATFIHSFPAEVSAQTYNEVGYSQDAADDLFSRIVLPSTINVGIGQQLQTEYVLTMGFNGQYGTTGTHPITQVVDGWPYSYTLSSIVHSGTDFTVNFDIDHHYSVGDIINISNAVMPEVVVTSISSDANEFTVISAAVHLLEAGDSVVITGASVGGYNASWTVASVTDTTTFVVTETSNFGAATGGTVRETPFPYFNDEWVIDTIPTANSITITDATIDNVLTDAVSGDLEGDLSATAVFEGEEILGYPWNSGSDVWGIFDLVNSYGLGIYTTNGQPDMAGLGTNANAQAPQVISTQDKVTTIDLANHSWGFDSTFTIAEANSQTIRGWLGYSAGRTDDKLCLAVKYDQNQRKDSGFTLRMGWRFSLRPELA